MRVLWVLLAILSGGAFFVIYLVMAFVVPDEPLDETARAYVASEPGATPAGGTRPCQRPGSRGRWFDA